MSSLYEVFAQLPDPRSPLGRRYPLPVILSQATEAMLGGARSLEAIAQFGRDRGPRFARALGFTRDEMPCKATFHNVFKVLDAEVFEQMPHTRHFDTSDIRRIRSQRLVKRSRALRGRNPARDSQADGASNAPVPLPSRSGASSSTLGTPGLCLQNPPTNSAEKPF